MGLHILSWPFLVSVNLFLSGMSGLYMSFEKKREQRLWYLGCAATCVAIAIMIAKLVY